MAHRHVRGAFRGECPADLPVQASTRPETVSERQDRKGARAHRAGPPAGARGRSDRIEISQRKNVDRPTAASGQNPNACLEVARPLSPGADIVP
jgi:hypothetical protein